MTYCKEFRESVLNFHEMGNSERQTAETFNIGRTTLKTWKKAKRETGSVEEKGYREVSPTVFHREALHEFVKANPLSLGRDIAQHFGGTVSGAYSALKRERLTLK